MTRDVIGEYTRKLGPPRDGKLLPRGVSPEAYGLCVICGRGSTVRTEYGAMCGDHWYPVMVLSVELRKVGV